MAGSADSVVSADAVASSRSIIVEFPRSRQASPFLSGAGFGRLLYGRQKRASRIWRFCLDRRGLAIGERRSRLSLGRATCRKRLNRSYNCTDIASGDVADRVGEANVPGYLSVLLRRTPPRSRTCS